MSTIKLKGVSKRFKDTTALDNISLTFEENKIYGLLGRNGAGKSTMLNIICNRVFADRGEVIIDGENACENDKALAKIYCMSENDLYPESCRIKDIFKLVKSFYPEFDIIYAEGLAEKFKLNINKKSKSLSTGYTSIYKLILALASNAPIVFFDEPVLGLDANHRELFYKELISKYSEKPATYIISTHLIEEAADLIEKVVIIKEGRLILDDDIENVLSSGYSASGPAGIIDSFCVGKDVLSRDVLGGLKTAYIRGNLKQEKIPDGIETSKLDLQKLFIHLTNA